MTNDQSRLRRQERGGSHAGYPSRVAKDGCAVEMKQRCLACPLPLPAWVLIKPALFVSRVREECGLWATVLILRGLLLVAARDDVDGHTRCYLSHRPSTGLIGHGTLNPQSFLSSTANVLIPDAPCPLPAATYLLPAGSRF